MSFKSFFIAALLVLGISACGTESAEENMFDDPLLDETPSQEASSIFDDVKSCYLYPVEVDVSKSFPPIELQPEGPFSICGWDENAIIVSYYGRVDHCEDVDLPAGLNDGAAAAKFVEGRPQSCSTVLLLKSDKPFDPATYRQEFFVTPNPKSNVFLVRGYQPDPESFDLMQLQLRDRTVGLPINMILTFADSVSLVYTEPHGFPYEDRLCEVFESEFDQIFQGSMTECAAYSTAQ